MTGVILKLKALYAFLGLVRDPNRTELVFQMDGAMRKTYTEEQIREFLPLLSRPDVVKLHADRSNPKIHLEQLRSFPEGSFGKSVARFLDQHGFKPNEFPMLNYEDPIDFMISRIRQSHDLWHVLADYETDVAEELALQGFTFGQLGSPISILIISAGLVHLIIKRPLEVAAAFERIVEGWERGKRCQSLAAFRWEDEWETDLEVLRRRLEIGPRMTRAS